MIKVEFKVNGKKVDPSRIADVFERAIYEDIKNNILRNLKSVICEEHKQKPQIVVEGTGLDNLQFKVSGCCQEIIDQALEKLK